MPRNWIFRFYYNLNKFDITSHPSKKPKKIYSVIDKTPAVAAINKMGSINGSIDMDQMVQVIWNFIYFETW